MGGLPYFKCYAADFLSDPPVMAMTDEELGFYWRLLLISWLNEGIPEDRDALAKLVHTPRRRIEKLWPAMAELWVHGAQGKLVNPRLEKERKKAKSKSESAQAAAEARWGTQSNGNANAHANA